MVDENLPKYWDSITGMEQKKWYVRELYNREVLGIQTIDDVAFNNLKKKIRKHKYVITTKNEDGEPV